MLESTSLMRILVLCSLLSVCCVAQGPPSPRFEDVAKQAGLTVPHIAEKRIHCRVHERRSGLHRLRQRRELDIVTVNGSTVDLYRQGGDPMVTLYHQDSNQGGNPRFTDITKSAGLTRKGWGMGVAVADFDNDGLPDLYVTGFGGNVLYRNLGNCKFEDVTEKAGLRAGGFGAGAAWGDYDRDGNVDLFIARYVHLDIDNLPEFGSKQDSCTLPCLRRCNAGPSDFREKPIFSFAIAATARSRR